LPRGEPNLAAYTGSRRTSVDSLPESALIDQSRIACPALECTRLKLSAEATGGEVNSVQSTPTVGIGRPELEGAKWGIEVALCGHRTIVDIYVGNLTQALDFEDWRSA
jgi:hypothetical protein